MVKNKHYTMIGLTLLLVTLTGTSALILLTKKVYDGETDQQMAPYNRMPLTKIFRESFGVGGKNMAQCRANQEILNKADSLTYKEDSLVRSLDDKASDKAYKEAAELCQQSIEYYKQYPGLGCARGVSALSELARCQEKLGLVHEREATLRTLVQQAEIAYNSEHQQVASALESLGELLCADNRSAEALPLLQRAYNIRMKGAGPQSADTAYTMSQLAHCYLDLKNYKEADELYIKAIAAYKSLDGDGFSEAQQIARENLANSYCWQDRYQDAMDCEISVLSDLEKNNLGTTYYAGKALASAGDVAARQQNKEKMQEYLGRAEKIALALNKTEDAPKRAELYNDIAEGYNDCEDYKNELTARQNNLASFKSLKYPHQEDQENFAQSLVKTGYCALKLKQLNLAKDCFGQALSQARDNQDIRSKLRANKEQIEEYLRYIKQDKRAARDATMKMQASELKQILVS